MQKHVHYDLDAAGRAIDAAGESVRNATEMPRHQGVQARLLVAVSKPLHIAILAEFNRGSAPDDVMTGIAAVCANAIAAFAT